MPKVVISGYYGFHNSGDEAILHAMLQALRGVMPGLEVTVLSREPGYTTREFDVRSVSRNNPWQVFQAIKAADMLISGGGGLLQDVTSPRSIIYYLGVVAMAVLIGKPVFFYAQGIGPVHTALGRTAVRLVVNHVNAVTVRDADSKSELVSLGVKRPHVQVTADPVLGLEPLLIDVEKGRKILASLGVGGGPVAGLSVIPWKGLSRYKEVVARAADDLTAQGWQVLLIPMHNPVDIETCREVAALMRGKPPFMLGSGTKYKELLSIAANLDLAVGMRLHFLIFSAIFGVPVVGISYDPKVNRFLQSLGLPTGLSPECLEYNELSLRIKHAVRNREKISADLQERVALLRKQALKNASLAVELIRPD
ncbi:polysaccharide pyruvyl transferase CsaB [Pelotomaculum terephthalicicum JT]|uniref:polysaccharide pyruvyl transferase CsaB n=1 Tax=Pelotomaculum TaxID=191373 RepID=UPI0009CCF10D|nr:MULTISPECIES: polysaccharide pyruvyl transferase CsaB [Pelotomaculum]MCG9966455.1 polysaccharide pyruvyl transferase CsaB [Pelotomaculum terephthalicicum JT]OPX89190.1 MAG: colanic acid biosynthesis protein [Pelotomaculum sp. PtaB.Bin117]OPY63404.1 MAG: colanic acid biosynthesis protein [Pelotomaculum sp. PtaU1.Bin065]